MFAIFLCLANYRLLYLMSLLNFHVINFRSFPELAIEPSPYINLFYGLNGSGKTSILEAIYFLGLGRSFRTNVLQKIIKHNSSELVIYANALTKSGEIPVGVRKTRSGESQIKISHNDVNSRAELADLLPLQLITQNSYRIFELGPKFRRQFIDWGLFHVEQSFFPLWKKFSRVLEQRNAALKANARIDTIALWDDEFVTLAEQLDGLRTNYINKMLPELKCVLNQLLGQYSIDVKYNSGWDTTKSLRDLLRLNRVKDLHYGYTSYGPHRADLLFYLNNQNVADVLSRGQLKLLIFALNLAQGKLVHDITGKKSIYLIDDIGAELDFTRQKLLGSILAGLATQVFVTGLNEKELLTIFSAESQKTFHVEHTPEGSKVEHEPREQSQKKSEISSNIEY